MDDKVTVSLRIRHKNKAALDRIAASMDRDRSFLINEAIDEFLTRHKACVSSIKRGLTHAKRGTFATDEEVEEALAAWER